MTGRVRKRRVALPGAIAALAIAVVLPLASGGGAASAKGGHGVTLATQTYTLSTANNGQRFTVSCPGHRIPFGGGMTSTPPPDQGTGEGIYPHSYERLGVQHGYHITASLVSPSNNPAPRLITLQVLCGSKLGHMTPPHTTVQVNPGESKTAIATCPGKRHLIGGGFQRTDFSNTGGDYVTASHAISSKSWEVDGHAFGDFGGEMTAIAYCLHSKQPLVTEVSGTATIQPHQAGTATTTPCPAGRKLVFGGFSTDPAGSTYFTNGGWNPDLTRSATGFDNGDAPSTITVYGYCLRT